MTPPLVESRQQTITAITDEQTGRVTPAIISTETITIDPVTGTKSYTMVTRLLRTVDGRLTKPDATYVCRQCKSVISSTTQRSCNHCTVTLCATCAGNPSFCNWCRWKDRAERFWTWLRTLT